MLAMDFIEPAQIEWKAHIVFAPNNDRPLRYCVYYPKLKPASHLGLLYHTVHGRLHQLHW